VVTLDETSLAILRMAGLYHVATRSTIATLLPEGGEPDKRLAKLVKDGLLRIHKGLPGNRSVYQLSKKGAGAAGVSPARGRLAGAQSLLKNLGVLLFCHASGTERHRVESEDLGEALGVELPDGAYCLGRHKDKTIIFDCYVPGPLTPVATVTWHLKKRVRHAKKIPTLAAAIKDRRYAFAIVVSNKARRKTIMDAVRTRAEGEKVALINRAQIWVEAVTDFGLLIGTAGNHLASMSSGANQTLLWPEP